MIKIKLTEEQKKRLGLIKESDQPSDPTASTRAILGSKLRRLVISGDPLKKEIIVKAVINVILRHDKNSDAKYFDAVNKVVSKKTEENAFTKIKRDLKSINTGITVEPSKEGIGGSIEVLPNGLIVDTALSSLKPAEKIKVTKEQFDRIFIKNLNERFDSVDMAFNKAFSGAKINNLGEDNFRISNRNTSLDSPSQGEFGKSLFEAESQIDAEIKELIKYLYGKTDKISTYWEKNGLSYDDIIDTLLTKNMIINNYGSYQISKSLGSAEEALKKIKSELSLLVRTEENVEETSNLPLGAEYDSNAPWLDKDYTKPKKAKKNEYDVVAINKEAAILKDSTGSYFYFYFGHINKKDLIDYAEVEKRFIGKDEDGEPEFELSDDFEINDSVISNYVNTNLPNLSKGNGIDDYELTIDLVKIDQPLKNELLSIYDKDKEFVRVLSSINEINAFDMLKKHTIKSTNNRSDEKMNIEKLESMAKNFARLYEKPYDLILRDLKNKYGIEEITTAASSGAFTPALSSEPEIVSELTAGSGAMGQYDANALPNITRDGSFKKGKTPKAFKKTQYSGGSMVNFDKDCVNLNNKNKAGKGGCSTGAIDNVVKLKKTTGNINAPSLQEKKR